MIQSTQVTIIGGGLAGLTAALDLLDKNYAVLVFEKNDYPKHKVCGEFISNEVLPYLKSLGIKIENLQPTHINKTQLSTQNGTLIETILPLGGFGVSRYTLDNYLYSECIKRGATFIKSTITNIAFKTDTFTITTQNESIYTSKIVLGAFGKRSNLDINLHRKFIQQKSPWLGVKAHYKGNFPNELVALHNFKGGYCGVSKVENNHINICYLVQYKVFKKYKNITDFQEKVLFKNKNLKKIFQESLCLFKNPISISQISFEKKPKIEQHILMLGDAAGLIHPLCGNGMAMAIHSAKIASSLVNDYLQNKLSRIELEQKYTTVWDKNFKNRIRFGTFLSKILLNPLGANFTMKIITAFPSLLPLIIKKTHGKPF